MEYYNNLIKAIENSERSFNHVKNYVDNNIVDTEIKDAIEKLNFLWLHILKFPHSSFTCRRRTRAHCNAIVLCLGPSQAVGSTRAGKREK